MKSILKFVFISVFSSVLMMSCNSEEDAEPIQISKIKVDSISIVNDTMDVNSVQSIKTFSTYTNSCHYFYGYDYQSPTGLEREVTAYQYSINGNCNQATYVGERKFNFNPQVKGTYTFKFWKGDNDWITQNIVVE